MPTYKHIVESLQLADRWVDMTVPSLHSHGNSRCCTRRQ